jgi:hypothetical protein
MNLLTRPVAPVLTHKPLVKLVPDQQPLATRAEKQNSRAQIGTLIKPQELAETCWQSLGRTMQRGGRPVTSPYGLLWSPSGKWRASTTALA